MSKSATTYRAPVGWDCGGLPPWTYHNDELTGQFACPPSAWC